jgi:uncharacterized protein (DUF362 family)
MKKFTKIRSLFDKDVYRSTESLSKLYTNIPRLVESISKLTEDNLTDDIIEGKSVLLKPNWVKHSTRTYDDLCLRTHDNFLLAVLEVIIQKKPKQVTIGDAPIQGCNWHKVVSDNLIKKIDQLSKNAGVKVNVVDFRRVRFNPLTNEIEENVKPMSDYVVFDLGKDSYLEPITSFKNKFRVTDYDPDRLAESHKIGVHKYCITKELFKADVIISLPKIKTHQKAGITAALKNIVGLNGDKDFLPHHRIGGTGFGGDCYPGSNPLRLLAEMILDKANKYRGKLPYKFLKYLSLIIWKLTLPQKEHSLGAAWHGNDTTWRMVLDLNKIVLKGNINGDILQTQQRLFFSIGDGIIGGQGNGPLSPDPLPLGIISFSNHSELHDIAMASLMGFDIMKIPMLKRVMEELNLKNEYIKFDNSFFNYNQLKEFSIKTNPAPGWKEVLDKI